MKKLLHTLLIAAVALSCFPLQSCLNDDDKTTATYSDCAITSITLGTLKCVYHGTAKDGSDSIYIGKYSAASCQFTIDQYNREIYNTDSLPAETDATKIVLTIGTRNGGHVFLKSATSDSIVYHNATDSVDFTTNPRLVYIRSNDGSNTAVYKLWVNIHKESPKKMTWNTPLTAGVLKDGVQSMAELNGNLFAKTGSGICSTDIRYSNSWKNLGEAPSAMPIVTHQGYIYSTDGKANLIRTKNGVNWETGISTTAPLGIKKLLGSSAGKLYAIANDAAGNSPLVSINTETGTATLEELYDNEAAEYMSCANSLCSMKDGKGTTITGLYTSPEGTKKTFVLYKAEQTAEPQKWMLLANDAAQNLPDSYSEVVSYGNYLVALSGGKFYSSIDCGRSWQERSYIYTPWGLSTSAESHLFADSRGTLWIITPEGTIYTGKLNEVAW